MTILFIICTIVILVVVLYAHHKHLSALQEVKDIVISVRNKIDPPKPSVSQGTVPPKAL